MNNISVTVRNRLGAPYGEPPIEVNEDNGQERHTVNYGYEVRLPLPNDGNLQSLEILPQSSSIPYPITINSLQDYVISDIRYDQTDNKWRIEFGGLESSPALAGEAAPNPPPVNVTVGQDEPDGSEGIHIEQVLMYSGLAGLLTLVLTEVSTILGLTVPIASLVAAIVSRLSRK